MMKHKKIGESLGAAVVMGVLLVSLSGCDTQEGPAERAGKEMDNAAEEAGEGIEKAGEAIQDAAEGDKK